VQHDRDHLQIPLRRLAARSFQKAAPVKERHPEERAAQAAAMPAPANVVTLTRDQPMPPIVDQAERIVAKYNQLDLDGQSVISDLIRALVDKRRK
jgi:hypothetical protein